MNQTKRTIEDVIEYAKANGSTLKASEAAAIVMGAIIAINLAVCGKTEAERLEYISSIRLSPNARMGMAIIQEKGGQA